MAHAQTDVVQTPPVSAGQNTADVLKVIDRLLEQNRQLEK